MPSEKETDREIIEDDRWATCWICEDVFRRKRGTKRYCDECGRGFCEGEHGSFAQQNRGLCLECGWLG